MVHELWDKQDSDWEFFRSHDLTQRDYSGGHLNLTSRTHYVLVNLANSN